MPSETKRSQTQPNEAKRSQTKPSEAKRNEESKRNSAKKQNSLFLVDLHLILNPQFHLIRITLQLWCVHGIGSSW